MAVGLPEFVENPENPCPVILLLDTSGSMSGQPIQELNTTREIQTLPRYCFNSVNFIVFRPNGQTLASGSYDGTIKIWRIR